jgi:hypothetical protein
LKDNTRGKNAEKYKAKANKMDFVREGKVGIVRHIRGYNNQ